MRIMAPRACHIAASGTCPPGAYSRVGLAASHSQTIRKHISYVMLRSVMSSAKGSRHTTGCRWIGGKVGIGLHDESRRPRVGFVKAGGSKNYLNKPEQTAIVYGGPHAGQAAWHAKERDQPDGRG